MKIDTKTYLNNNGIRPSHQRILIFDYLYKSKNHPNVETIYKDLANQVPTLSKTTVYNTLKLFIENNIAIPLNIDNKETRYDAKVNKHGHFKCVKCGTIYDFHVNIEDLIRPDMVYKVEDYQIYLKGVCIKCKMKINN